MIALLGIVGVAIFLSILRKPWLGLAYLVAFLPFNALITQLLGSGTEATAVGAFKDIVLSILVLSVLTTSSRFRLIRPAVVTLLTLIFILVLGASFLTPNFVQALYGFRNDYYPLLLLAVVPAVLDRESAGRISTFIVAIAQGVGLLSVASSFFGLNWLTIVGILPVEAGEVLSSSFFSQGSVTPRVFSPFTGPNELAVTNLIYLALIFCREDWRLGSRVALSALPVTAILMSESRSGALGLALLLVTMAIRTLAKRGSGLAFAAVTVLGLGAIGAVVSFAQGLGSSNDFSFQGHAVSMAEAIPRMVENPFGHGLGQVGPRAYLYSDTPVLVESYWLLLALEAGLVVLLLYLALLAVVAADAWRSKSALAFVPVAALAASVTSQVVLPTLQEGAVCYTLWIVIGIGVVNAREARMASGEDSVGWSTAAMAKKVDI